MKRKILKNPMLSPGRVGIRGSNSSTLTGNQRVVGGLDEDLDVDVIRTLQGKTTIIPVISKADTVTTAHMAYLKRKVF